MKFGENLYNLRKSSKMSQEKLAEKMEVTRQSVSKWENGESYPEMEKIMKLCNIFHCKINDLVHEDMTDINSLDEEVKMSVVKFKEEKQQKMKGLSKAIYVIARIGKIMVTIAIPIVIICMLFLPYLVKNVDVTNNKITFNGSNEGLTVVEENIDNNITFRLKYKNIVIADVSNQETIAKMGEVLENNSKSLIIAYLETGLLFLVINLFLYRIILKHLEDLFIDINNGDTPFTLKNVHHIKQIAFLMIATIVLSTIPGAMFELILKSDLNVELELFDVVQILFLFSMAYIFEYGYEIQLDSKGKMYGDENE
jgi:transcriptional regulator with XRE-family HTH domain